MTLEEAQQVVRARDACVMAPSGLAWALANPPGEEYHEAKRVLAKRWLQRQAAADDRVREGGIPGADIRT